MEKSRLQQELKQIETAERGRLEHLHYLDEKAMVNRMQHVEM